MQAEFWLERWEQNQIGFHEQEINSHLQKYWGKLNLPKKTAIQSIWSRLNKSIV